jgi:hypothetical protein
MPSLDAKTSSFARLDKLRVRRTAHGAPSHHGRRAAARRPRALVMCRHGPMIAPAAHRSPLSRSATLAAGTSGWSSTCCRCDASLIGGSSSPSPSCHHLRRAWPGRLHYYHEDFFLAIPISDRKKHDDLAVQDQTEKASRRLPSGRLNKGCCRCCCIGLHMLSRVPEREVKLSH